jgi:hypothetical protein
MKCLGRVVGRDVEIACRDIGYAGREYGRLSIFNNALDVRKFVGLSPDMSKEIGASVWGFRRGV